MLILVLLYIVLFFPFPFHFNIFIKLCQSKNNSLDKAQTTVLIVIFSLNLCVSRFVIGFLRVCC
ncbi:hypothetical protein IC582_007661 [Cucumis melo]